MSGLVVLEGKWSKQNNLSVKSLFDVMIDINFDSPHKYYYETFANSSAFRAIVNHICGRSERRRYLYIGAHGENDSIWGSADSVSRTEIRNVLHNLGGGIKGIFLGSCSFGNEDNARYLFDGDTGVPASVRWIAGYGRPVDWIESAVLDMLFWNTLLNYAKKKERTQLDSITRTCDVINELAPGLANKWSFQVFTRTAGRGAELTKLINV